MGKLRAIFIIPELRQKILLTLLFLAIYRIGYHIPLPFVDQNQMFKNIGGGGTLANLSASCRNCSAAAIFSQATIFGWGIMPYISASIIFQLLGSRLSAAGKTPKRRRERPQEDQRIHALRHRRHLPVQSFGYVSMVMKPASTGGLGWALPGFDSWFYWLGIILMMTCGTIFLMWLGEQIDEYGIGNGISLIIMAGIIARMPAATAFDFLGRRPLQRGCSRSAATGIGFEKLCVLILLFVVVVVGVIAITKGQRRIPTQSAKHVRGRRVFGGTQQFLPLKVNQAGVMPVIFASSLLVVPGFLFASLLSYTDWSGFAFLSEIFSRADAAGSITSCSSP